jgi:hypothetical protein
MSKLTIRKNAPFSERELRVLPENFEDGIKYALDNNCDGIFLDYRPESKNKGEIINFDILQQVSHIRSFIISPFLELNPKQNIEGLHALKQLKTFGFHQKHNFPIDFSFLPELENLFYTHSKKATNFNSLKALVQLKITALNAEDCTLLKELQHLKILHIIQSSISSLNGLESLKELREVELKNLKALTDVTAIASLPFLEKLFFEKCPLTDYAALRDNRSLSWLVIEKADSIDFIKEIRGLKRVGFAEVVDGNLNPLLELPALELVQFYPNKKHYTHTEKQINELIKNKVH